MELALKTAMEKLDYVSRELTALKEKPDDKPEKLGLDSAIEFLKARARQKKVIKNDNAMLIIEIQSMFKGRWGKNVLKDVFEAIAQRDKDFRVEKHDKQVYLISL